uniref:Uncharacterized protein n=1 Tax=Pristionchus pacificus TaxID=54126 RepID=A0A2A6D277_PRIPA|eukprot:PDM84446.1 hypothetical protein PRIPAC_33469 [Pristionchus pacificus]
MAAGAALDEGEVGTARCVLPSASTVISHVERAEQQGKRPARSPRNAMMVGTGTPACDMCRSAMKQKLEKEN